MPANNRLASGVLRLLVVMTATGAVMAGYLWWLRAGYAAHPGCHASGDCSYLWFSSWGSWFGQPVSALALIPYAVVLLGITLAMRERSAEGGRILLAATAVFLLIMVIWFMVLQGVVIKQWCRLCLFSHALSTLTGGLIFLWLKSDGRPPPLGAWFRGRACAVGLALGMAVVAGHSVSNNQGQDQDFKPISVQVIRRLSQDRLRIFDRETDLGRDFLLVSGTLQAPEVIVILEDYTCSECRRLHGQMSHVIASMPGRYAEMFLPAPLNPTCNPVVKNNSPEHAEACELAKIACVVGRFQPTAFPAFHHWLMTGPQAPPLGQVRERAQALLGNLRLEEEVAKADNLRPLTLGVQTFESNLTIHHLDGLPLLLTEKAMFLGAPENMETWVRQFKQQATEKK